jgi:hypothetical protein
MCEDILLRGQVFGAGARQDLEAHVELDQHGLAGLDLVIESDRTQHGVLEVSLVDGNSQVRFFGLYALDIGERGIAQLNDELLVVN